MFRSEQARPQPYLGPERRRGGERRKGADRREMIRFEPGKDDRRSGKDRRRNQWDDAHAR